MNKRMNKQTNKYRRMLEYPSISRLKAGKHSGRMHPFTRLTDRHIYTHTSGQSPVQLHIFRLWGKPYTEETHNNMGRKCKLCLEKLLGSARTRNRNLGTYLRKQFYPCTQTNNLIFCKVFRYFTSKFIIF